MTRRLAKEEGLLVGWSGGSAVFGALEYAKENLKEDDMMVIILHDHGTRYLGKVFNDDWMKDHGFLEEQEFATVNDIIDKRSGQSLLTINYDITIEEAVNILNEKGIDQIPVVNRDEFVGSLSSTHLLQSLISNPAIKGDKIGEIMEAPLQFVSIDETLNVISSMFDRDNRAVLVRDTNQKAHIITQHDLLTALTK
jgi:cystathionine beta-synthase